MKFRNSRFQVKWLATPWCLTGLRYRSSCVVNLSPVDVVKVSVFHKSRRDAPVCPESGVRSPDSGNFFGRLRPDGRFFQTAVRHYRTRTLRHGSDSLTEKNTNYLQNCISVSAHGLSLKLRLSACRRVSRSGENVRFCRAGTACVRHVTHFHNRRIYWDTLVILRDIFQG